MKRDLEEAIADTLLHLHDRSMSDDPETACRARLAKQLLPVILEFSKDEHERGTEHYIIALAFGAAAAHIVCSAGSCAKPGHELQVVEIVGDHAKEGGIVMAKRNLEARKRGIIP